MSQDGEPQKAAGGGGTEEVPDPELDSLLDEAIQDFTRPPPPQAPRPPPSTGGTDLASLVTAAGITAAVGGKEGGVGSENIWTEEFVQHATAQFEQTMRALMERQQQQLEESAAATQSSPVTAPAAAPAPAPLAPAQADPAAEAPQLDFSAMATQFAQFADAASKSAEEAQSDADFTQCLADTLKQISDNNAQLQNPPSADDLTKMFGTMGLGGGEGPGGEGGMGALFPLMQVMLENVLSKEVLYSPMKDITDKYPDWLADHRATLPEDEFTRYNKQYDIMKQVVELYEGEKEDDSEEVRGQRFEQIMLAMQKLQELGQPPKDLVGDMGPMMNFDAAGNPVMPDLSSVLGAAGMAPGAGADSTGDPQQGEQCSLM